MFVLCVLLLLLLATPEFNSVLFLFNHNCLWIWRVHVCSTIIFHTLFISINFLPQIQSRCPICYKQPASEHLRKYVISTVFTIKRSELWPKSQFLTTCKESSESSDFNTDSCFRIISFVFALLDVWKEYAAKNLIQLLRPYLS